MQPPWIFTFPSEFFENISHGYVFGVKESNGDNEKILSSLHDLENQGQTPFCMTFLISGCKHDTVMIVGGRGLLPGLRNIVGPTQLVGLGFLVDRVARSSFRADCAKARPFRKGRGSKCRKVGIWNIHHTRHRRRYVLYKMILFEFRFFNETVWIT